MQAARWTTVLLLAIVVACARVVVTPIPSPPALAMWVWTTETLLDDPDRQQALFAFARERNVAVLWAQVTTGRPGGNRAAPLVVTRADAWRNFLRSAHAVGLRVEALDGDPVYAARPFHQIPLQITDAVLAFNAAGPPSARFDGLHFDNEPYLLPAWHDPGAREVLLRDYLDLNLEIQARVATQRPMQYGVDLPFWWHHVDERTGESAAAVTYDGRRQSAALHAVERLDRVTIMDYRNTAEGPDGIVALARGLLEAADRAGRARVRVGVETAAFPPSRVWFVLGREGRAAARTLSESWRAELPGSDYPLRVFDDGVRVHLGIVMPAADAAAPAALVALASRYGVAQGSPGGDAAEARALARLERDPEWSEAVPLAVVDPATAAVYHGVSALYTPLPKITFASRPGALAEELAAAHRAFSRHPSYQGMAIHHYDAYRELPSGR